VLGALAVASFACILAVWGLYPLTVWALARMRRRTPLPSLGERPAVTVVVATRADVEMVSARVTDLLSADYPRELLDVVVAYDARTTEAWIDPASFAPARVSVVRGDAPGGKAAALNAGLRAATGEVVVFADAGQRFSPDAIRLLVDDVRRDGVGAASGRLELPTGAGAPSPLIRAYWRMETMIRRSEAAIHSSVGVTGAIYAMRRALWTPLPAGLILDDVYVPMRLVLDGHRVGYVDGARAVETRPATEKNEYHRKVRTLTGNWQLCAWLPRVLVPFANPIWPQFMFHKLLRLFTPYWAIACALWAMVTVGRWIGLLPFAGAMVVGVALIQLRARPFAMIRRALATGIMLQMATVTATANGARKRWDVWQS
jgi:cellulose synthase/poly-beta-1,6-N-acetylglucosamine synthase-like glycosyltransferase